MNKAKFDKWIARLCKGEPHRASHDSTWDEAFSEIDAALHDRAIDAGLNVKWNDSTDFLRDAIRQDTLGQFATLKELYADFIKWLD